MEQKEYHRDRCQAWVVEKALSTQATWVAPLPQPAALVIQPPLVLSRKHVCSCADSPLNTQVTPRSVLRQTLPGYYQPPDRFPGSRTAATPK